MDGERREIAAFLQDRSAGRRIVFVTYHSSSVLAGVARKLGITFDLAVLDEAHKTVGARSKSFATLLFDRNARIRKRLFMTATERVVRGGDETVLSMDDVELYGPVVTVRADQRAAPDDATRPFRLHERLTESFRLPDDADADGLHVYYAHGALEFCVPRRHLVARAVPVERAPVTCDSAEPN